MDKFEFNSESSFSKKPDYTNSEPVSLSFKDDKCEPAMKVEKKRNKNRGAKALAIVAICICLSLGSGAFGAYIMYDSLGDNLVSDGSIDNPFSNNKGSGMPTNVLSEDTYENGTYAEIAARVKPMVVEITTEQVANSSYFQQYIKSGAGSGVIISDDGYIITNNHVIDDATKIIVRLTSGSEYEAKVVGSDTQGDIAVIKIDAKDLPCASIGDSSALVVGQEILAIGNPLGSLGGSVTNGIISALDRELTVDGQKMVLLQTNAAINPGNSGGGLFNMRGELIAIVNAKSAGSDIEGLGFAIPINYAFEIAKELRSNGYVTGRPSLGISYIEISDYMDLMRYGVDSYGVYIYDGGETELENGDRVTRFGDYEVANSATFKSAIQNYKVGDVVTVSVVRNGEYTDVVVTLVEDKPSQDGIELQTDNN